MSTWLEQASQLATAAAPFLGGGSIAIGLGVVRVGPGRALGRALRSRLFRSAAPRSLRLKDVQSLRSALNMLAPQSYIVVSGPKGVGKTCVIDTATERTCGIVGVSVAPGTKMENRG